MHWLQSGVLAILRIHHAHTRLRLALRKYKSDASFHWFSHILSANRYISLVFRFRYKALFMCLLTLAV